MPRKLLKFIILFDNTSLLYFPGQFLSGRVLLELQDDTPALGLHFHVVGEGVVRVRSARQERTYDRENFIDFRMRLLGGGELSILFVWLLLGGLEELVLLVSQKGSYNRC